MKIKPFLLTGLAGLALAGAAQAQTTIIDITGATAFRTAAVTAINSAFASQGNFRVAFTNTDSANATTSLTNGTYQIFSGSFPGITGTTIIRTSWNGSVEGVRALADTAGASAFDASYLLASELPGTAAANGNPTGIAWADRDLEVSDAELSFSDVAQSSTPVAGTLQGGPVGVVVFTMIANKEWKDDNITTVTSGTVTGGVTTITAQQFKTLAGVGKLPLSFFTGNSANTDLVYLTGRNDGSGTRTTYLVETGFGISNPVVQYVVHNRNEPTITKILKTAQGGAFNFQDEATPGYASTVWGFDQDGNGGYSSGGDIRLDMSKNSSAAAVWEFQDTNFSGTYEADEDSQTVAPANLYLVTWLSTSDARTARGSGTAATATAQILGYNGVILPGLSGDSPSSTLSAADKALVANGKYTAWGYQQLYHLGTTAQTAVFNDLKTRLNNASTVGSAGMPLGEMNVSRTAGDGSSIAPGALP